MKILLVEDNEMNRDMLSRRLLRRGYELVFAGDGPMRPQVEAILRRYDLKFELRTSSDEEVCYDVQVPLELRTDRVSNALLKLDPEGHASVEWADKKAKGK